MIKKLSNIVSTKKYINLPLKLHSFINQNQNFWWIKITTTIPRCIYFFGPFDSSNEAKQQRFGYIDDLVQEKAFGITVEIKKCNPTFLTIVQDSL